MAVQNYIWQGVAVNYFLLGYNLVPEESLIVWKWRWELKNLNLISFETDYYLINGDFNPLFPFFSFSIRFFSFSLNFLSSLIFSFIFSLSCLLATPSCLSVFESRENRESPLMEFFVKDIIYISRPRLSNQLHTWQLYHI